MEKIINDLIELSEMVKTAIAMAKNEEDLNGILSICCKQLLICADHFDYVFNKSSKKIGGILENEKQESI